MTRASNRTWQNWVIGFRCVKPLEMLSQATTLQGDHGVIQSRPYSNEIPIMHYRRKTPHIQKDALAEAYATLAKEYGRMRASRME
jgi:hypothetical protein